MTGATARVVGIDPGAHTGLVCVDVPIANLDLTRGRWIGASTLTASVSRKLTDAEQDATLWLRIFDQLVAWAPVALVVLEEPSDVSGAWVGKGRRNGRGAGTGTAFALGRAYGLALAAAKSALHVDARIVSYPVTTRRGKALGWMQGRNRTITPREQTMFNMAALARTLGATHEQLCTAAGAQREDVLMALGVLRFHTSCVTTPGALV